MPDDQSGHTGQHPSAQDSTTQASAIQDSATHGFATRLSHAGRAGTKVRGFVNPPVHRGSTMLHVDIAARKSRAARAARSCPAGLPPSRCRC